MNPTLNSLISIIDDNFVFAAIAFVFVIGIVFGSIKSIFTTRARERSRREIAAYIAEGSMSAEQGAKLMKAADPSALS